MTIRVGSDRYQERLRRPEMLSQREALAELLTVSLDDVKVGYELGSGSFSSVYQIKPCPKLVDDFEQHSSKFLPGDLSSEEMATRRSEFSTQKVFALKRLSEETLSDPQRKEVASEALKFEADLLSRLPRHDNLISLHAVSSDFWNSPEKGFLVLECLRETLDLRLKRWRNRASMEGNRINLFRSGRHHVDRRKEQQSRVVNVGLGIAEAMAFLHRHRVLFRDLKPCNVGFGIDGKVRVFDFGLARILHEEEDRRLTFLVGSLRYMAPEVAQGTDYGFSADVHSFAILLWEICTLQKAFASVENRDQLRKVVSSERRRPSLRPIASPQVKDLLKASWDPNPELRPSFAPIVEVLRSSTA